MGMRLPAEANVNASDVEENCNRGLTSSRANLPPQHPEDFLEHVKPWIINFKELVRVVHPLTIHLNDYSPYPTKRKRLFPLHHSASATCYTKSDPFSFVPAFICPNVLYCLKTDLINAIQSMVNVSSYNDD